jgi:hypothetical protein
MITPYCGELFCKCFKELTFVYLQGWKAEQGTDTGNWTSWLQGNGNLVLKTPCQYPPINLWSLMVMTWNYVYLRMTSLSWGERQQDSPNHQQTSLAQKPRRWHRRISRTASDHGRNVGIIVNAPKGTVTIRALSVCTFFSDTFRELLESTSYIILELVLFKFEHNIWMVSIPCSYSVLSVLGPEADILTCFIVVVRPCRQMLGLCLKTGHDGILIHSSHFLCRIVLSTKLYQGSSE